MDAEEVPPFTIRNPGASDSTYGTPIRNKHLSQSISPSREELTGGFPVYMLLTLFLLSSFSKKDLCIRYLETFLTPGNWNAAGRLRRFSLAAGAPWAHAEEASRRPRTEQGAAVPSQRLLKVCQAFPDDSRVTQ